MKGRHKIFFWALMITLVLACAAWLPAAEENKPASSAVAVVNGSEITRADFDREMKLAGGSLSRRGQASGDVGLSELREKVLDRLITLELLYQESEKKGIKVDKAEVDEHWTALRKRFPGDEEFNSMLNRMNLTEVDVKFQMERTLSIKKFVDAEFAQKVTVSEKEIRAFYDSNQNLFKKPEEVRARHILISVDAKADEAQKVEARKKIENIQQRLRKGEDFSALAKEFSQCPSSARGGDLGYFRRGQMAKPFEEAAFALKPGEVSDIVGTQFGYHIIKVDDKKADSVIAYDEAKDRISQYLKTQKVEEEVDLYAEKLRGKAKIQTFLTKDE